MKLEIKMKGQTTNTNTTTLHIISIIYHNLLNFELLVYNMNNNATELDFFNSDTFFNWIRTQIHIRYMKILVMGDHDKDC